jgi:hypothetical protein
MIKPTLILVASILLSTAVHSQFRFGTGIDTDFDILGLSVKGRYDFTEQWGGQVGFSWFLNSNNPSRVDLDATYLLTTAGEVDNITISGLGGFNYWNSGITGSGGELGLNIGGNISFPISDNLYYIEPRITLISNSAFFVGLGTYF